MIRLTFTMAEILRIRAEEVLKTRLPKGDVSLSEAELLKLVHDVEIHQIELEMLNDELLIANEKAAKFADDKYAELYDLAPTGYFTLSREGEILEVNLCGARMFGKERLHLHKSRFGFFVSGDTRPVFNNFLDELFAAKTPTICEVTLTGSDSTPKYVQLTDIESHWVGSARLPWQTSLVKKRRRQGLRKVLFI